MSKNNKIIKINKKSLISNIIIEIRANHIKDLIESILIEKQNIIPIEWIDEKIRIDCIQKKKDYIINDEIRKEFLISLFMKECKKDTAKIISEL